MTDGNIVLIDNKNILISNSFPSSMSLKDSGINILSILKNKFKNKKDLSQKIIDYTKEDGFVRIANNSGEEGFNFINVNKIRYNMEEGTINFQTNYFGGLNDDVFGWNSEKIFLKNTSNKTFLLNLRNNEEDLDLKDFFLTQYYIKPNETIVLSYGGIGLEELVYNKFVNVKTEEEIIKIINSSNYKKNETKIIKEIKKDLNNVDFILEKAFCFKQDMKLKSNDFGLSI